MGLMIAICYLLVHNYNSILAHVYFRNASSFYQPKDLCYIQTHYIYLFLCTIRTFKILSYIINLMRHHLQKWLNCLLHLVNNSLQHLKKNVVAVYGKDSRLELTATTSSTLILGSRWLLFNLKVKEMLKHLDPIDSDSSLIMLGSMTKLTDWVTRSKSVF